MHAKSGIAILFDSFVMGKDRLLEREIDIKGKIIQVFWRMGKNIRINIYLYEGIIYSWTGLGYVYEDKRSISSFEKKKKN